MKIVPLRTCMGCNSKKEKKDLIRIVRQTINKDNKIIIDKTGKQNGRGAYICNNIDCLEKSIKSKRLEKVLDTKISKEVFDELKEIINGGEIIG